MGMQVERQNAPCGAVVRGVNLSGTLTDAEVAEIRKHWLEHQVIAIVDQDMSVEDIERFALTVGPFGSDPFFEAIPGHPHVAQVRRDADEKTPIFAEAWHSDWSFQKEPPAATLLRSEVTPPVGGDTLFADCARAYDALSDAMKAVLAPLRAVHSASRAYGAQGVFAKETAKRTMEIIVSPEADKTISHPLVRTHPVTGRKALYVSPVYTVGIEGMTLKESQAILGFLFAHMTQDEFVYRHRWRQGMLLMWDNRNTVHYADGGYDGHLRVMHRTTVAGGAVV